MTLRKMPLAPGLKDTKQNNTSCESYEHNETVHSYITSNSFLRISSFLASDLELLCTSKIRAIPATYILEIWAYKLSKE